MISGNWRMQEHEGDGGEGDHSGGAPGRHVLSRLQPSHLRISQSRKFSTI
jgi:hypothetical protein